ncbi:AAA family ATPase [Mycobacterium intracellulare]|uniref:AAA family ATPase n=1 Tax=Mycobacterium intracellulare TaxID=1767 RepID=UPI0013DEB71E|nr:AAA family ATPase [Mycobacterium intracellulare]
MSIGHANEGRPQSLSAGAWLCQADADGLNGWTGPIPIGKERNGRYKDPWVAHRHGWDGTDAVPDEWEELAAEAENRRRNGTPGILALGERLPAGVLGVDVDAYDGKNGKQTLEDWAQQWGPLPPTYIVTARRDGVSGIRLYRVPEDYYPKEIPDSGVEFLDRHHRYMAVPPSWHHTGQRYRLLFPNGRRSKSGVLPSLSKIPLLPQTYLDGLPASATVAGGEDASDTEVAEFGQRYDDGPLPEAVLWIIGKTIKDPNCESVRNAIRDALCWAAREAKGKRFGWDHALDHIRTAAKQAYEKRGRQLDEDEFGRLTAFAIGQVRDTSESELYDAWQSDDWQQGRAVTDDDPFDESADPERRIEQQVKRELEKQEVRRRVVERTAQARIEIGAERAVDALTFLTEDLDVEPLWGDGSRVIWAQGEGLMIVGPQGVGKSTLAQQLCLARKKLREPELLGFPVAADDRPILYLAMDRRAQIRRSLARMVDLNDDGVRDRLASEFVVWPGPIPVKANESPDAFCEWVRRRGRDPGLLVVDSLKDLLSGLIDDSDGIGFNDAVQLVLNELRCDVVTLHHQRKATADNRKPNKLSDVYGNSWLTAGQGSVVLLWGEAGRGAVEFNHLKQPQEKIEAFTVRHSHSLGSSSSVDVEADVLSHAATLAGKWFTLRGMGRGVYKLRADEPMETAQKSKLTRVLKKLTESSILEHRPGSRGGSGGGGKEAQWRLVT